MKIVLTLVLALFAHAAAADNMVLRTGSNAAIEPLLASEVFSGLSVIYYWSDLEPRLGQYDFSAIDRDLAYVRRFGKSLMIMVRDKSFKNNPVMPVPAELEPYVVGSASAGYLAKRWNPQVNTAFRNLILALGNRYNSEPDFRGFKTSETAPGMALPDAAAKAAYRKNLGLVIETMAQAFPDKQTYFYMNWGPRGTWSINYWGDIALANGVGLGGPDIHPDVDMPSYRYFKQVNGRVPIMMDVQYSNYSHGTPQELKRFGENILGAGTLVWLPYRGVDYDSLLAR